MMRKPVKPPAGAKLKETPDMIAWRKEFDKMKESDHLAKMRELGLDDDDLEEFKEIRSGKSLEEGLLGSAPVEEKPKETPKKKAKK
ncbi:MAG: hypothetical protein GX950_02610 [Candidatus Diapherotrites archaeon]|jgi:hypothetical protein|uniref:Uncharacterized protein n=1 Tax=Candidatus Iainarchaeum sp. TaxID=3101447 RepID=A0A7K4BZV3_9ARCH|nr:hypothetical protein [Candidatus Diapherotrites archaeon]